MNITKEEVQRLIEAFHADPHTADWDDALSLLRAKRDEKDAEPVALDAIYAAWHGAGIDILGGDWTRFVGMLSPLYTHPAHDDTALLRMALGQLGCNTENMSKGMSKSIQKLCARENTEAITALRERLGEKA